MKLFFDTEFTGLHQNTTLISLGIVSENGDTFYAEFTDYDESQVNDWIQDNVIDNLKLRGHAKIYSMSDKDKKITIQMKNTKKVVKRILTEFLDILNEDGKTEFQLYSDVCHYDMVLFAELFGGAFGLPENISPCCHDINRDIGMYYEISEKEAFDKNREDIIRDHYSEHPLLNDETDKHNSLYDAKVIKTIYDLIFGL